MIDDELARDRDELHAYVDGELAGRPRRGGRGLARRRIPRTRRASPPGARRPTRSARAMARSSTSRCRHASSSTSVHAQPRGSWRRDRGRGARRRVPGRRRRRLAGARRVGRGAERAARPSPARRSARTGSTSARCAIRSRSGASEAHLLPWLSRRVGTTLRAPDLGAFDLKLLGGRLLPGRSGPAALFMYESANGERFTIYCSQARSSRARRSATRSTSKFAARALGRRRIRLCGERARPTSRG